MNALLSPEVSQSKKDKIVDHLREVGQRMLDQLPAHRAAAIEEWREVLEDLQEVDALMERLRHFRTERIKGLSSVAHEIATEQWSHFGDGLSYQLQPDGSLQSIQTHDLSQPTDLNEEAYDLTREQ